MASARHHNRDRACSFLGLQTRTRAIRDDNIHLETHQLGGKMGESIAFALGGPVFDGNVLTVYVTEFTEPLQQRFIGRELAAVRYPIQGIFGRCA
jgi:hypothetical protein